MREEVKGQREKSYSWVTWFAAQAFSVPQPRIQNCYQFAKIASRKRNGKKQIVDFSLGKRNEVLKVVYFKLCSQERWPGIHTEFSKEGNSMDTR
jgi:hypothetical protein